jgi:hypothetical protein
MKTVGALVIAGIWLALPIKEPAAPAPTPPSPAVLSTGGAVTGTNQGSSCSGRSGQVQTPGARTDPLWWVEENDWPQNAPFTAPGVSLGCSR